MTASSWLPFTFRALATLPIVAAALLFAASAASAQAVKTAEEIARDLEGPQPSLADQLKGKKSRSKNINGTTATQGKSISDDLRRRLTRALSDGEDQPGTARPSPAASSTTATAAASTPSTATSTAAVAPRPQATPPKPQVTPPKPQTVAIVPAADREELAQQISDRDLDYSNVVVLFALDSDRLLPAATPQLDELAKAIKQPKFKGVQFIIAGHTDAIGTPEYNLNLSQRRATAVRAYLMDKQQVASDALLPVGYGEDKLKNPNAPLSPENRRVQIVNGGAPAAAGANAVSPNAPQ